MSATSAFGFLMLTIESESEYEYEYESESESETELVACLLLCNMPQRATVQRSGPMGRQSTKPKTARV